MDVKDLFILVGLFFLFYSICLWSSSQEHFEDETTIVDKIYDALYAGIYKPLWHSSEDKLGFERVSIQDIALSNQPITDLKILDMACGISQNSCFFTALGVEYIGVDTSSEMLEEARKNCPTAIFKKGDITQVSIFTPKSFSTCLLLGFAIYEFPNSKVIFDNAYAWLKPDSYFVVHMVDPDKYDPLLDLASPFAGFSLQKYSFERQTKSEIYFNDFKYIGELKKKKDHDDAIFKETFVYFNPSKNPSGTKYREQSREWNMPSVERLIEIAKTSGFRLKEKVSLRPASKEYQYLVYFTK